MPKKEYSEHPTALERTSDFWRCACHANQSGIDFGPSLVAGADGVPAV